MHVRGGWVRAVAESQSSSNNIKVICRVRPLNQSEKELSALQCVHKIDDQNIAFMQPSSESDQPTDRQFQFDHIFAENEQQQSVYEVSAKQVVNSIFQGFNGTILAYGQTSSGKTHTMMGYNI